MERNMIREFYQNELKREREAGKISRETREGLEALLREMEAESDPPTVEKRRDELYLAACAAEENGFVKGFRYAFRLFMECVGE